MNFREFTLTVSLVMIANLQGVAADTDKTAAAAFVRIQSFSYSDTVSIHQILSDMEGDYPSAGHTAFTHNSIEVGVGYGAFEISVFQRYDYYMEFTSATAELIYLDKNNQPVTENRTYDIDLDANHLRAKGIKLAYRFSPHEKLHLHAAVSYLRATQMIDGWINGVITTAEHRYSGELFLDYTYTEDVLFDRRAKKPEGRGFALDLYAAWQAGERLRFDIGLQDAFNRIRWDRAPFTEARITSHTVHFDEDGFLETSPVLSGFEGYRKHHQRLPLRAVVSASYEFGNSYHMSLGWRRAGRLDFPELGVRYDFAPAGYWSASYNIKAQALGIGYGWNEFEIGLTMDSANLKRARNLGLNIQYRFE